MFGSGWSAASSRSMTRAGPSASSSSNGPLGPVEAPAHGAIDVDHVVGDLGDQLGGIAQGPAHHVPGEAGPAGCRRTAAMPPRRARAPRRRSRPARQLCRRRSNTSLLRAAVVVPDQAIEAAAGLAAELAALDHRLLDRRQAREGEAGIAVGQIGGQVSCDQRQHVEADQIEQPVQAGRRDAHRRRQQRVDLLHREALGQPGMGLVQAGEHPEAADPVADEVHRVLGVHHALAEPVGQETLQRLRSPRRRCRRRAPARPASSP